MLTIFLRGNHTITYSNGASDYKELEARLGSSGTYDLEDADGKKTRLLLQNIVAISFEPASAAI